MSEIEGMKCLPRQYADKPNLWRLACELSKFKNPYAAFNVAMAMASPILEKSKEDGAA